MKSLKKTSSELWASFAGAERRYTAGTIVVHFALTNPYYRQASLHSLKFRNEAGEWLNARLADTQEEPDLGAIPLSGKKRLVPVVWSAADDFRIMQAFPGVELSAIFADRPLGAGALTEEIRFTVDVDFTVPEIQKVIQPRGNDPYLQFEFLSPRAVRPCWMHFRLSVDTAESFDSPALLEFDSSLDTAGWQADGGVFPEQGVDGQTEARITFSNAALQSLPAGDYFYRILPVVNQFYPQIDTPADGQVYIGDQVFISGTIQVSG